MSAATNLAVGTATGTARARTLQHAWTQTRLVQQEDSAHADGVMAITDGSDGIGSNSDSVAALTIYRDAAARLYAAYAVLAEKHAALLQATGQCVAAAALREDPASYLARAAVVPASVLRQEFLQQAADSSMHATAPSANHGAAVTDEAAFTRRLQEIVRLGGGGDHSSAALAGAVAPVQLPKKHSTGSHMADTTSNHLYIAALQQHHHRHMPPTTAHGAPSPQSTQPPNNNFIGWRSSAASSPTAANSFYALAFAAATGRCSPPSDPTTTALQHHQHRHRLHSSPDMST